MDILTSLHGHEIGLSRDRTLVVPAGVDGIGLFPLKAKGDGVADDTRAFQRAINAAKAVKGTIIIPRGWYKLGALTITGADEGVNFVGEAWNSNLAESTEFGGVVLELISGTNASLFTIATDCAPCHFENIYFRGNQAGQTSGTSRAVHFSDAVSASRSGTFYRCRFERWRSGGVYVGNYRDAGKMDLCTFLTNGYGNDGLPVGGTGADGITLASCNDWRLTRVDSGANGRNGYYLTGASTLLASQCNGFSNVKRGIQIDAAAGVVDWRDGSFDRNEEEGLLITGSSSTTNPYVRKFSGCWFSGNGDAGSINGDIRIIDDPNGWTILDMPVFNKSASANNYPAYSIFTSGTTDGVVVRDPKYLAGGNAPYGTAFTNDLSKLVINNNLTFGSGAPGGSARKGTIYIRTDGSSTSTRAYINTDGSTTWTNFTTAT